MDIPAIHIKGPSVAVTTSRSVKAYNLTQLRPLRLSLSDRRAAELIKNTMTKTMAQSCLVINKMDIKDLKMKVLGGLFL